MTRRFRAWSPKPFEHLRTLLWRGAAQRARRRAFHCIDFHVVPLSQQALDVSMARCHAATVTCSLAVLPAAMRATTEVKPHWIGRLLFAQASPPPAWRLHDLRRTFVTHINDLAFAEPHVVEAIGNHLSGRIRPVLLALEQGRISPSAS